MSRSQTPENVLFPLWSIYQEPGVNRYLPLPTPTLLKQTALFGLPLRSALTNETISDATIQHYIDVAISEVEHEFDLYVRRVKFYDRYDFDKEMFSKSYAYLKLNHPNVTHVNSIELTFSNDPAETKLIKFPNEFVHVMPQEGVIQLVPAYGQSFTGFLLSAFSGVQYHALKAMGMSNFPGGFRIEYECGYDANQVPAIITNLIENLAAKKILANLGPVLFPHNSVGISIDGVSQSVGTQGTNFLTKKMADLDAIIEGQKDAIRAAYQRRILVDSI